jgi:putative flippase GtrA
MMRATVKFCVVGALVAALDFGALWLFKQFMPRLLAVSLAYFIGVSTHFCLNKWWVFGARANLHAAELARYILTVLACWLCTMAIVSLALRFITENIFIAKATAIPPTTILGFLLMRFFVFR